MSQEENYKQHRAQFVEGFLVIGGIMQRHWKICLILAGILCLCVPMRAQQALPAIPADQTTMSPSAIHELNEALPGWLQFSGQVRFRAEGYTGGGFKNDSDDSYLLTRVYLNMRVQATSWLKFYFQGMDSHAPWKNTLPANSPFRDTMDLHEAYVDIGGMEDRGFALRTGRQVLAFGEERLVGPAQWLNTPRTFDATHGKFQGDGYRVDAFAASVVKINQGQFDERIPGNNFYGLYTSFSKWVPQAVVEPYFFWRRQSGLKTETATPGTLEFGTYGARWVGKLPHSFDYGTEMAKQSGSLGTESTGAWAGHWIVGYTIVATRHAPRLFAEYNFATGDKVPKDNNGGTFNQLYPSGHDKLGLTDLVGWQNIKHIRGGIEVKLNPKWSFTGKQSAYWLDQARDGLYNSAGAVVARSAAGTAGTYVGQEFEAITNYRFNSRTLFSGGFGHLDPGTFLKNTTPGVGYNYPFAMVVYDF